MELVTTLKEGATTIALRPLDDDDDDYDEETFVDGDVTRTT